MVSTHLVPNLLLNQENVVNRGSLTRWKPPVRGIYGPVRRRRGRARRMARGYRHTSSIPVAPDLKVTLVCSKNNFWGLFHRADRLVRTISAGSLSGFEGSKRGRLQAAGKVAEESLHLLRRARRPRRRARRGRRRGRPVKSYFSRRPRKWNRRGRRSRRGHIHPWGLSLVGWTIDKRWKYAWTQLNPRGRVLVGVRPIRSHNGLRGCSQRRK